MTAAPDRRTTRPSHAWARPVVHGLVGAVFGAAIGLSLWAFLLPDGGLAVAGVVTLAVALAAAVFGDRFWGAQREGRWWSHWW